jgi:hypothetical protein
MTSVEQLRKRVEEAEQALATTKESLSKRGAQINSLERQRGNLLVATRLGDGPADNDSQRLKLVSEIEGLRAANDDDSVVIGRLSSQLELDRKRLAQAERESDCESFLDGPVLAAAEVNSEIFRLANDLREALEAARDHDIAVEKDLARLGLKHVAQGLRIGVQVSIRRGELVSAILADFVPTPLSRQWLSLVGKTLGPASVGAATDEMIKRVEEERQEAASALRAI